MAKTKTKKSADANGSGRSRIFALRLPTDTEARVQRFRETLEKESRLATPRVTMTDAMLTALDRGLALYEKELLEKGA